MAFKPILPKPFGMNALLQNIDDGMNKVVEGYEEDFDKTVADFSTKPDFTAKTVKRGNNLEGSVTTEDENYIRVVKGTRPHIITGNPLVFPAKSQSKTVPRVIGTRPGRKTGGLIYTKKVRHPGIKAREFDEVIKKKWEKPTVSILQVAMGEGAKASGHSI